MHKSLLFGECLIEECLKILTIGKIKEKPLKTFKLINIFFFYFLVYTHPGPSGGYPDPMSYMMDGQQMMHRPPGDPAFHQGYHYPPAEYYPHHL